MPKFIIAALLAIVAFCPGCGSSEHSLAPVSGVITLDGAPLAQVGISFQPMGSQENPNPGPGSGGQTDATGRFELTTMQGDSGAVIGKHRVVIASPRPPQDRANDSGFQPVFKDPIPARYNDNSELTYEVPADGTAGADFKLTTTP